MLFIKQSKTMCYDWRILSIITYYSRFVKIDPNISLFLQFLVHLVKIFSKSGLTQPLSLSAMEECSIDKAILQNAPVDQLLIVVNRMG